MSGHRNLFIKLAIIFPLVSVVFLSSCGDSNQDAQQKKDHVWKSQTDTIEKAKAVEGILQDSADTQRQKIQDESE